MVRPLDYFAFLDMKGIEDTQSSELVKNLIGGREFEAELPAGIRLLARIVGQNLVII